MTDTNIQGLQSFAEAMRQAPAVALEAATIALDEAGTLAVTLGRSQILRELNLRPEYVHKHLTVSKSPKRTDLESRIAATRRSVLATRYGADQATAPATSALQRLSGDPYRKIPKGQKAAGSVAWAVQQGGNKKAWRNTFFVYLKTSGAWAMVARMGKQGGLDVKADWQQNLKVINSTSVDQAWRNVREDVAPDAMALAEKRFLEEFGKHI